MGEVRKAYSTHDGRMNYAVVARSRTAACKIFNANRVRTSVYEMSTWGGSWKKGEQRGTDALFEFPGLVFTAPLMSDQWVPLKRGDKNGEAA